jgi:hypothetical protein
VRQVGADAERVVERGHRVEELHLGAFERSLERGEIRRAVAERHRRRPQAERCERRQHVVIRRLLDGDDVSGRREQTQRERDALARALRDGDLLGAAANAGFA